MRLKNRSLLIFICVILLLAACGPAGPIIGLGPVLDQLVGLLLLVALIVGGFWAARSATRSSAGQAIVREFSGAEQRVRDHFDSVKAEQRTEPSSKAQDILRERYARGEIDRTQYLEMLDDLKRK